jgi:hypothetical protein
MIIRSGRALPAVILLVLGCGGQDVESVAGKIEAVPIPGRYEVRGATVAIESGHKREIAGIIILSEEGGSYTATFDLATTFPGAEAALPAQVIGKGEGTIEGRTLRGTAQTQLVMAAVPGVDPGFAFIRPQVSTRLVSTTVATIADDGNLSITIENQPAQDEDYAPTRTTLRGLRVSALGIGGGAMEPRPR